jgi:glycosyltransferase involved in cell wall biosynthesis
MVKLSVIVPVYNVQMYLAKCLDSIINQTFTDFELILVNDGSTDNSREICSRYVQKDSRIILLDKKNEGLSSARNYGLSVSSGKFIAFVDSDDWIDLEMYVSMVEAMEEQNADIVICGHNVVNLDGTIKEVNTTEESVLYQGEEATKLILEDVKIFSFSWDKIYKKELFNEIEFPVGRIYEDIATTFKLFDKTTSVYHLNRAYYYYLRRQESICNEPDKEVLRIQQNFLSFHERYLFVKANPKYNDVLFKCEEIVLRKGISLLHLNARFPKLFDNGYFIQLVKKLLEIKVCNNPFLRFRSKFEYNLLSISPLVYWNFLRLFFLLK